nr:ribonuclease H-like domain-containing protein [Tanacetum cinerariifolium]
MVTRSRVGTTRPNPRYAGHVSTISPLPRVPRPEGANIVRCMWLFRHKFLADDTLSRYKARLVANGRLLLDVNNAFLHGDLVETVYMHQPPGFQDPMHPNYVCLLQRSLYGLKQAPRAWFQRFAAYITTVGFTPSRCDPSLFIYKQGDDTAFLLLYVDDIFLTASSDRLLQLIIASLHREFSMTDLGALNYFLGISVTRNSSGMFLSHCNNYAIEILKRAHMVGCNPSRTPVDTESKLGDGGTPVVDPTLYRSLAGSFQYLTFTRPDITLLSSGFCVLRLSIVRTKHIEIDIHFVRDLVSSGQVRVLHVPSRFQYADIFTNGLPSALFDEFRDSLSVRCTPAPTAWEY